MTNEWMLDVLADLRTFSNENSLMATQKQLEQVIAVATAEISSGQGTAQRIARWSLEDAGELCRQVAKR